MRLRDEGMEPVPYVVGRKGVAYYRFRNREMAESWTGFSEQPTYENAKEIADALIERSSAGSDEGGIDEIHIVFTEFVTSVTQRPKAVRLLPLVVEETDRDDEGPLPLYEFEPSAEGVLDALLPRYLESRVWNALLQSAAAESAARRRAMKSATDNADELIKTSTRAANAARQAEITQEISEIVGGAEALSGAQNDADKRTGSESDMTETIEQSETGTAEAGGIGRVVRVIGPVVDVEFAARRDARDLQRPRGRA